MWYDELIDPDFQDQQVATLKTRKTKFSHQSISSWNKNILDAVTGIDTGYKIGSIDEYRFYVVMENDPDNNKDPRRLYFKSPTEYERVTGIRVSEKSHLRYKNNRNNFGV